MEFIRFLRDESPDETAYILMLSLIYAVAAGLFGPLLLQAIADIIAGKHYLIWLCILPGCAVIQVLASQGAESRTTRLAEAASEKMVLRIADSLRREELPEFEQRDPSEIYLGITGARAISEGAIQSITVFQNLLISFVLLIYMFHLCETAGLILLLVFGLAVLIQELFQRIGSDVFHETANTEARLFDVFHHFLNGFKEIKVCDRKNHDLFENYLRPLIRKIQGLRYRMVFFRTELMICIITMLSLFMLVQVFFLRSSGVAVQLLMLTLYADKFFWPIIGALPKINEGQAALARLRGFAAASRPESDTDLYDPENEPFRTFQTLTLQDVIHTYHEADGMPGFSAGPLSLILRAGELVFLAGGNGCGKSTLVKILTGLYPHESGTVLIDGNRVNLKDHRYLFSAIFSDFHLFDALYGVETPDEEQVEALLEKMQLTGKTDYADGRFTTQDLSAGQRRRMAMITALLEDKPFYVFDEWAADQDPHFRRYFYEELLPLLKEQGKTVLAVTHDDAYYHLADRLIFMKDGKITDDRRPKREAQQQMSPPGISNLPSDPLQTDRGDCTEDKPHYGYHQSEDKEKTLIEPREFIPSLRALGFLAVVDGMNAVLKIHILFTVAGLPPEAPDTIWFCLYLVAVLLDFTVTREFNRIVVKTLERGISDTRTGIIDRVRKISLASFEKIGAERIYTALTADLKNLADLSFFIAIATKFSLRMLSTMGYFVFLAPSLFMLGVFIAGGIGVFYVWNQFRIKDAVDRLRDGETAFFDAMTHLLKGFKELRLNNRKNDVFFHVCVSPFCSQIRLLRQTSAQYLRHNKIIVYGALTLLLGMLPLIIPFFNILAHTLLTCMGILFYFPVNIFVLIIPIILLALTSVQRLWDLKQTLEMTELDFAGSIPAEERESFRDICCQNLIFRYQTNENHPFSVGPMNMSFQAGEILFVTGGNGSGKSTFLKMLTGLYAPDAGEIILNGQAADIRQHRHLFSFIFSDFHLFDRLYGFPEADESRVNELITLMGLEKKVKFAEGKFSTTDLSSGQKKRLALVGTMIEDRPIYVFDEWAAEQDPHFRGYFYETLVPAFKAQGKTVIAVTHHDQYFYMADRVVKIDQGRIMEIREGG